MNIEIERSLNGSFLIIKDESVNMAGDELTMLINNNIPGFISVSKKTAGGMDCLYYDISSMISLESAKSRQEFKYREIKEIIYSLVTVKNSIEEYMLNENGVILNPEYVFLDTHDHKVKYCFYPFYDKDIFDSLNVLSEFLLRSTDHTDKRSVKAIYEMYSMIQNGDFSFENLILQKESTKTKQISDKEVPDTERIQHKPDYGNVEEMPRKSRLLPAVFVVLCAIIITAVIIMAVLL